MKPFLVLAIASLLTTTAFAADAPRSFVKVTGGSISGEFRDGVNVYKGIPYAAPPVGDLRWAPPADVLPWTGTRDATKFSDECMQAPYDPSSIYYREPQPMSEDCLCLNVWTAAQPNEKRPVMVWIHGGALTRGSGSTPTYDGTNFAEKGVVLVTINYRLNVFGFFSHPELSAESPHGASGNQGVLDQIAALKWVRDNISAFGGDPDRVTIFGESAGSWSVCSLMATPLSKGLFHRAIGQSGGVFNPMAYLKEDRNGQPSAESSGVKFADSAGAESLQQLRALSAEQIIKSFGARGNGAPTRGIVDGWVFPKEARHVFAAGEQHPVPVIVGSNAKEMTTLTPRAMVPTSLDALKAYIGREYKGLEEEFLAVYPAASDAEAGEAFLASARDRAFSWQMRTWARMTANVDQPAYLYYFTRVPPVEGSEYLGAFHAAEIGYVFQNLNIGRGYNDVDTALAEKMSSYWVNFAATGDPNGDGLEIWPAYDPQHDTYMDFGDTVNSGMHLLKRELDFTQKAMDARFGTD